MAGTPTTWAPAWLSGAPSGQKISTSSPASTKWGRVLVSRVTMPSTFGRKVSVKKAILTGFVWSGVGAEGFRLAAGPGGKAGDAGAVAAVGPAAGHVHHFG